MNWLRRQLMRPSATALLLAVDSPFFSAAYSVHGRLTNEVQNGVSLARFYDSFNRPTGYSLMHDAQCTMHNGGGANPSTFQPSLTPTTFSAASPPFPRREGRASSRPPHREGRASSRPPTLQLFNHLHLRLRPFGGRFAQARRFISVTPDT